MCCEQSCMRFCVDIRFQFYGYILGVELLGHMIDNSTFNLWRNCPTVFARQLYLFTFLLSIFKDSNYSTSSSTLVIICLTDYSHPNRCEVGLICISQMANIEHLFMCLLVRYISSMEKWLCTAFAHF